MKFIITGSGGCVCTPKPLCQCDVCTEARKKGFPYKRCGCSLYLEDSALLIDTPEDIASAINNADLKEINHIMYSHWDPDHTLGMRIVEQLRLEWFDYYDKIKPQNPITILAEKGVMEDINGIRSKYGPILDYYEHMGLIKRSIVEDAITLDDITITLIPVSDAKAVSIFIFESQGKKVVYAPCDCTPFPQNDQMKNADLLIIGNAFIGDIGKNGSVITDHHPLRTILHSFEGVLEIAKEIQAKKVIITHIEECWGKSYDDYLEIEKQYDCVKFAFDGMVIEV